MAEIILITGGCRSGKSRYAESMTRECGDKILYIATAPILDKEMEGRVRRHKQDRAGKGWKTVEEEIDLAKVLLANPDFDGILVDCLTLWINNLIFHFERNDQEINEDIVADKTLDILKQLKNINGRIVFVINEVGMGVVPENRLARLFRDLSGKCAQTIAEHADSVILMSCGIPLKLK